MKAESKKQLKDFHTAEKELEIVVVLDSINRQSVFYLRNEAKRELIVYKEEAEYEEDEDEEQYYDDTEENKQARRKKKREKKREKKNEEEKEKEKDDAMVRVHIGENDLTRDSCMIMNLI